MQSEEAMNETPWQWPSEQVDPEREAALWESFRKFLPKEGETILHTNLRYVGRVKVLHGPNAYKTDDGETVLPCPIVELECGSAFIASDPAVFRVLSPGELKFLELTYGAMLEFVAGAADNATVLGLERQDFAFILAHVCDAQAVQLRQVAALEGADIEPRAASSEP